MSRPLLLLVDGESTARAALVEGLSLAGFAPRVAGSMSDALTAADDAPPAFVLAALDLPDGDALSLLAALRARPDTASVPLAVIAGSGAVDRRLRAIEAGVADYFTTPIYPQEIAARLRILLGEPAPASDPLAAKVAALGGPSALYRVNIVALAKNLSGLSPESNTVLRLVDGQRDVQSVLQTSTLDAAATLDLLASLAQRGIVQLAGRAAPPPVVAPAPPPVIAAPPPVAAPAPPPVIAAPPPVVAPEPPPVVAPEASAPPESPTEESATPEPIAVVRFPSHRGQRRERLEAEAASIEQQLAAQDASPVVLTDEVITPGDVPPVTLVAASIAEPPPATEPATDDDDEDFAEFARPRRTGPIAAAAVVLLGALAGGAWVLLPAASPDQATDTAELTDTPAPEALAAVTSPEPQPPEPTPEPSPEPTPEPPPAVATALARQPAEVTVASTRPSPSPTPAQDYDSLLVAARKAIASERFQLAVTLLDRALALRTDAEALRELGKARYNLGQLDEARRSLTRATQLNDRDAEAYLYLGMVQQELGQVGEAKRAYRRFQFLEPNSPRSREITAVLRNLDR